MIPTEKRRNALAVLAFALPVVAAAWLAQFAPFAATATPSATLRTVAAGQAAEISAVFDQLDYQWPPGDVVPPVAVRTVPDDIRDLSVADRKALFFRILAPLVAARNTRLREQRQFLEHAFETHPRLPEQGPLADRVRRIATRFNVKGDLDSPDVRALLLRRVDIVPAALVLAQAANESGWGTSRFAREANNLFGMWTWDEKAGIAPRQRAADATHFVRVFENIQEAVGNYLHTINTGPAYGELRELRAMQRQRGQQPDALTLAAGLVRYSARGEEYVAEIRDIIEYNDLEKLPPLRVEEPVKPRVQPASM